MERSVDGLLGSRPRAGRGGDNAAVVTRISMASSNFISAAVRDISHKATAVNGKVDRIIDKTAFLYTKSTPLQLQHLLQLRVSCTIEAMRLRLWCLA